MSAYTTPTGNYPPPHGGTHPPHPGIALSGHSPSSAQNNPLGAHHALPIAQPYQYEPQPSQHSPYNNGPNAAMASNPEADNIQYQPSQYQAQEVAAPATGDAQKANRLRKACDSCSVRKVKCDESGPPCRACVALDIPCTFQRPSRRRGPPNRHAEAMKKRKLESPVEASPTSPNNVAATLASLSHAVLNAESICPLSVLELLVDDFFTYIHPLAPFPHEPSFRAAFSSREDLKNPSFLALLASMVGALVASFPRRPRLHLKAHHQEHLFPTSMSLVGRCHKVAVEARGAGYLDKDLSVYDAVTSYFLGLAAAYTFQYRQCRLYSGEALNIVKSTGNHKAREPRASAVPNQSGQFGEGSGFDGQGQPVDYIQQEIGRRVFWIILIGVRSLQQLGASVSDVVVPPPTRNDPYPPPPLEVDDEYIFVNHIDPQPAGLVSKLAGFNRGIRIYGSLTPMVTMDMSYSIDGLFDWNRQKQVLENCLRDVKHVLDDVPRELLLTPASEVDQAKAPDQPPYSPMADYPGLRSNGHEMGSWPQENPVARRRLQYEIQKANIYISQLGTRSYIVEKYWSLQETYERNANRPDTLSSPGLIDPGFEGTSSGSGSGSPINVTDEREAIVRDLLRVLGSISQVNMEPNGYSLINKIRQIAATLLDSPQNQKGPLALKSESYLGQFLDVLLKLERASPSLQTGDSGEIRDVEEEELRNWANLREYQLRFLNAGGFLHDG